jgi:hypothetical protein
VKVKADKNRILFQVEIGTPRLPFRILEAKLINREKDPGENAKKRG